MKKYIILVKVNTSSSGGQICEGQEDDDWPNHEDYEIELESIEFFSKFRENEYHTEKFEITANKFPEKLYATIVRYYDGGTFGRTTGYVYIAGVFQNRADAVSLQERIESGEYAKSKMKYVPWDGYFAGLERTNIECIESSCSRKELIEVEKQTKSFYTEKYEIDEKTMLFRIYDDDFVEEMEKYLRKFDRLSSIEHPQWVREWLELWFDKTNKDYDYEGLFIKIGLSLVKFYKEKV